MGAYLLVCVCAGGDGKHPQEPDLNHVLRVREEAQQAASFAVQMGWSAGQPCWPVLPARTRVSRPLLRAALCGLGVLLCQHRVIGQRVTVCTAQEQEGYTQVDESFGGVLQYRE